MESPAKAAQPAVVGCLYTSVGLLSRHFGQKTKMGCFPMAESITNGRRVYTEVAVAGQKRVAAECEPGRAGPADWSGKEAKSNFAGGARGSWALA